MNVKRLSIQQREEGKRTIKRAIKMGILKEPTKCGVCGQEEGIIEYYISDYRPQYIVRAVKPLCWTCNRMLIMKRDFKKEVDKYFHDILFKNYKPIPVYKDDVSILSKYGIGLLHIEIMYKGIIKNG